MPISFAARGKTMCGCKQRSVTLSPPLAASPFPPPAVDAPTTNGCTPLYIAANNGFADAAALLLELGADPDTETTSGCTPLHAGGWVAGLVLFCGGARRVGGWVGLGGAGGQAGRRLYWPSACIFFPGARQS